MSALKDGGAVLTGGHPSASAVDGSAPSVNVYDSAAGLWHTAPQMSTRREYHSQSTLVDGRVLVCGGRNDRTPNGIASAEIFDPVARTWGDAAPMPSVRYGHTQSTLRDGRVLVCGGIQPNSYSKEALVYAAATDTWLLAAEMPGAKAHHTQSTLADGRVLVCGGIGGPYSDSVFIYDPEADQWTVLRRMGVPRRRHTQSTLQDGRIMVCGGISLGNNGISSAVVYNAVTDRWSPLCTVPIAARDYAQCTLADGRVLLCGNGIEWIYDDRRWTRGRHKEFRIWARLWVWTVLLCGHRCAVGMPVNAGAGAVGAEAGVGPVTARRLPRLPPEMWCEVLGVLRHSAMLVQDQTKPVGPLAIVCLP